MKSLLSKIRKQKGELFFQIDLNNYCQLDCSHCYLTKEIRKDKTIVKYEDYVIYLNKLITIIKHYKKEEKEDFKITSICLQLLGGEPLYNLKNKDFFNKLFSKIEEFKKEVFTLTNIELNLELSTNLLYNINKENILYLKQKTEKIGNFLISTSYEPDTNRFTVKTYKMWLNNLKLCKKLGFPLDTNMILTKGNVKIFLEETKEMKEIFKYSHQIYMYYFVSFGIGKINEESLIPDYKDIVKLLTKIYQSKDYFYKINGIIDHDTGNLVFEEDEFININLTPKGKINYNLGVFDIKHNNNLNDNITKIIINLNKYVNWSISEKLKSIEKQNCENCKYLDKCLGGIEPYSNIKFKNNFDCKGFYSIREKFQGMIPK